MSAVIPQLEQIMTSLSLDLEKMLRNVDFHTAHLLERTVRDAIALAERRPVEQAAETDNLGYPIGYFEATAGSFADEPLEPPAELPMQVRESW